MPSKVTLYFDYAQLRGARWVSHAKDSARDSTSPGATAIFERLIDHGRIDLVPVEATLWLAWAGSLRGWIHAPVSDRPSPVWERADLRERIALVLGWRAYYDLVCFDGHYV